MIKKITLLFCLFQCAFMLAQTEQTLTLGTGTSTSATRGPFQRSSASSSSVFSRASLHYSAAELTGLTSAATITQINFDLGSSNIITATGDATMLVYMKNSTATEVVPDMTDWTDIITGATLVGTYTFNMTDNFPGSTGYLNFELDADFDYTGGALEIAVDWDCSNLIPADASAPNQLFSGNGSLNWRWDSTSQASLSYRAGSSSAPSTIQGNRKSERVNTQIVYTDPNADITLTLGTGTSSSATRGPFQRSDSGSSSVFSRASMHYSATELASISNGATVTQINFDLGSTNTITAPSGEATMLIYMKNSTATDVYANPSDWTDIITGATLVGSYTFDGDVTDSTNPNFPGSEGFMSFVLDSDFAYTGNAIEVAVEWDCSNLVPADPSAPNQLFSGNGSLTWHWDSTTQQSLLYRAGSSSAPSSLNNRKSERANTQFVYNLSALSINENESANAIRLYPNPASSFFIISSLETIDSVEMYDLLGKRVTISLNGNTVDISNLSSAIYLVKITSGNTTEIKKLFKK